MKMTAINLPDVRAALMLNTDIRQMGYFVLTTPNPIGPVFIRRWCSSYRKAATTRDQLPPLQASEVACLRPVEPIGIQAYICSD